MKVPPFIKSLMDAVGMGGTPPQQPARIAPSVDTAPPRGMVQGNALNTTLQSGPTAVADATLVADKRNPPRHRLTRPPQGQTGEQT